VKLILTMVQGPESGKKREIDAVSLTIGRGDDNGWVIADPHRVLSKNHLKIDFREGQYILTDTSTNGVFVNGAAAPLGRDRQVMLNKGDKFVAGPATFAVDLVAPSAAEDPFFAALTKPPEKAAAPIEDDPFAPLPGSTPASMLPSSGAAIPDDFDLDLPPMSGDPLSTRGGESAFGSSLPPPAAGPIGGGGGIPDDWLGAAAGAPSHQHEGEEGLTEALWCFAHTTASLYPGSAVAQNPIAQAHSAQAAGAVIARTGGDQTLRRLFADLQELVLRQQRR